MNYVSVKYAWSALKLSLVQDTFETFLRRINEYFCNSIKQPYEKICHTFSLTGISESFAAYIIFVPFIVKISAKNMNTKYKKCT